ncbi:hypothetical protein KAS08_00490 [Candidatus Pacearchaeota archaeon]|nr:hypothetical protein [Candidatus Pacearchaeota archaeon]
MILLISANAFAVDVNFVPVDNLKWGMRISFLLNPNDMMDDFNEPIPENWQLLFIPSSNNGMDLYEGSSRSMHAIFIEMGIFALELNHLFSFGPLIGISMLATMPSKSITVDWWDPVRLQGIDFSEFFFYGGYFVRLGKGTERCFYFQQSFHHYTITTGHYRGVDYCGAPNDSVIYDSYSLGSGFYMRSGLNIVLGDGEKPSGILLGISHAYFFERNYHAIGITLGVSEF